jgi:hypothetical protein
MKRILARITLAFGAAVLALLLAECAFRLRPPRGTGFVLDATLTTYNPKLYARHPTQLNVLAPNVEVELSTLEYNTHVRTNSLGLRGPALGPKGQAFRILALGDSFTLGLQVPEEQTWTHLLSLSLTEKMGREVQVLNAGVDGYGTAQATEQMRRLAPETQPDWAILAFYLGNDLRDNTLLEERARLSRRPPKPETLQMAAGGGSLWFAKRSRIYSRWLVHKAIRARANDFRIQEYRDEMLPFAKEQDLQRLLPQTEAALHDFEQACQNLSIGCTLVLIPPAYVVDRRRTASSFSAFDLQVDEKQLERPAAAIRGLYRGESLVNLSERLRSAESSGSTYLVYDPHFSAYGHAAAAKEMTHQMLPKIVNPRPK